MGPLTASVGGGSLGGGMVTAWPNRCWRTLGSSRPLYPPFCYPACLPVCFAQAMMVPTNYTPLLTLIWGGALSLSNELSSIPLKGKDPARALRLFIHWPVIDWNTRPGWRGGELRWGPGACCYSAQKPTCPTVLMRHLIWGNFP